MSSLSVRASRNELALTRLDPHQAALLPAEINELVARLKARIDVESDRDQQRDAAREKNRETAQAKRDNQRVLAEAQRAAATARLKGVEDICGMGRTAHSAELAACLMPMDARVKLHQDVDDYFQHVLCPQATEDELSSECEYWRARYDAELLAAQVSHERMLFSLKSACDAGSRISFTDSRTTELQALAEESGRRLAESRRALDEYHQRHAVIAQQRQAGGLITAIEAVITTVSHGKEVSGK